jgi:DNA-binding transcriptional regulator GbsR (MarR family)
MITGSPKTVVPNPELDATAERVGEFIQYWGFKRIHGRIWTHLYLSSVPLDATTLVRRLAVSKALVSFSIHDLLEYNVIREVARGRGRTVLYEANPDVTGVILNVVRLRELKMMSTVREAVEMLVKMGTSKLSEAKVSAKKLDDLRGMIGSTESFLQFILSADGADQRDLFAAFQAMIPVPEKV